MCSVESLIEQVSSGKISPLSFYNLDIDYDQYFSSKHYLSNQNDNINMLQPLRKSFTDIEIYTKRSQGFPDITQAEYPVSAITFYIDKKYTCFLLKDKKFHSKIDLNEQKILDHLNLMSRKEGEKYIDDDETIEVEIFTDSLEMVIEYWKRIKKEDPAILSSYNGDTFDFPYLYYFLLKRLKSEKKVAEVMSPFSTVKLEEGRDRAGKDVSYVRIAGLPICDFFYYFKPRDDGGLGLGKKYTRNGLKYVAEEELGITKLEYAATGMSLDEFYEKDPINYLLYNLWDVALVKKLDDKTQILDLYNMIRREMKLSISAANRGSSPLFDTYVFWKLQRDNNWVRFGIKDESGVSFTEKEINKFLKPKVKVNWNMKKIGFRDFRSTISHFPGAYVKDPKPVIIVDGGFIIDFDAASLYPSMVKQYNISFDSYYGRILAPYMNKIFDFLEKFLGKNEKIIPSVVATSLMEMVVKHIESTDSKKKNDEKQLIYFVLYGLLDKLREKNIPLQNLLKPKNEHEYFVMRKYLLPYLELIEEIHPLAKEYHLGIYDYLINRKDISNEDFWIIENLTQPNCSIQKINGSYIFKDLFSKGYAITLTGCIFTKHDTYMGLFYDFVNDFGNYRSQYKKIRDSFPEYSSDYIINDRKQSAVKVIMNSMYGLLGMSTYRYSNKWLAKTVTTQGRLCLKTAQYMADKYLENRKNQ